MIAEKVTRHLEAGQERSLFTIQELKSIALKQKGTATTALKSFEESLSQPALAESPLRVNTDFFASMYQSATQKIGELVKACTTKQNGFDTAVDAAWIRKNKLLYTKRPQFGWDKTGQMWEGETISRRQTKGAHWNEREKELFINCLRLYGKDWEAMASKFPNKTIKQLRNFFQNNKDKMCLCGYLRSENGDL